MLQTYEQESQKKFFATVLAVLVVAGAVVFTDHLHAQHLHATALTTVVPARTSGHAGMSHTSTASTSAYKDGSYAFTSQYFVPHGSEAIQVDVTLQSGVISDVSVQNSENDFDSARYQEDFASVYKSYVVGKKLSGLQLSIIAGASDTTQAFINALSHIAAQAQA